MKSNSKAARSGKKLLAAVLDYDFETARALVADGADVNYTSPDGGPNVACTTAKLCNELFASPDSAKHAKAPACLELLRELLAAGATVTPGPFQTAAAFGNLPLFRLLLDTGTNVNELNDGTSAIFNAVMFCQEDIAVELLRRGADPWIGEPLFTCGPALHEAVVAGLAAIISACVEQKVDLNRRGDVAIGEAPPMTTTKRRDASGAVVSTKFEVHPRPTARGATALNVAVRCGKLEMVELLLEGDVDVDAADADGFTPLAWAIRLQRPDLADVLRAAGAKEIEHLDGSPLFALAKACREGDAAAVRAALARGPDVNATYDDGVQGYTPLMLAAQNGNADIVAELLNAGADPNRGGWDKEGFRDINPLLLAAQAGNADVVKVLLDAGARHDAERDHVFKHLVSPAKRKRADGSVKDTAALQAAEAGHTETMRLLLGAQAAETGQASAAGPILDAAAESGDISTLQAAFETRKRGRRAPVPSTSVLVHAVNSGNQDVVRTLLAAKANVNGRTRRGETALSTAVAVHDLPMVSLLLEAGARPADAESKVAITELMMAAGKGDANLTQVLLDAGADPNVQLKGGDTALHVAATFGFQDVVTALLQAGASTNLRNREGQTPIEKVSRILAGWIGENPDATQYKCRDLLQNAAADDN